MGNGRFVLEGCYLTKSAATQHELYNRDIQHFETLQARRSRIVRMEIERTIDELTPQKCENWYSHTIRYVPL